MTQGISEGIFCWLVGAAVPPRDPNDDEDEEDEEDEEDGGDEDHDAEPAVIREPKTSHAALAALLDPARADARARA